MTQLFYITKAIIVIDYTSLKLYIKITIWVDDILFNNLDNAWQYIMSIFNQT